MYSLWHFAMIFELAGATATMSRLASRAGVASDDFRRGNKPKFLVSLVQDKNIHSTL